MHIFLTGATGYVGSHVAPRLLAAGHTVTGLSRNEASDAKLRAAGVTPHRGDLTNLPSLASSARAADAVIHTAFGHDFSDFPRMIQNERHALTAFTDALSGSGKRFIASSASGVLGDTGDAIVTEDTPLNLDSPGGLRALAEQDALATARHGLHTVVLRLPFYVYGDAGSAFVPYLFHTARQTGTVPYIGAGDNRLSAVHVADLADLYPLALDRAPAASLYNAASEHGVTMRQIAEAVARATSTRAVSIPPSEAVATLGPLFTFFLGASNQVSAAKAEAELGWHPDLSHSLLHDIEHGSYRALAAA